MAGIYTYLPTYDLPFYKSYLVLDQNGEVNVRELNPFQTLARKFLGFYKETTLKHLIQSWNKNLLVNGNVSPELTGTITALWNKKYSQPVPIHTAETFYVGNSPVEDAEVVCIGQLFSDPDNTNFCGKILAKYYRPGDEVLVEGIDSNHTICSSDNEQTIYLNPTVDVQGWEPVGYEAMHNKVFGTLTKLENQLKSSASLALKLLNNVHFSKDPNQFTFRIIPKEEPLSNEEGASNDANYEFTSQNYEIIWNALLQKAVENFIESIELADQPNKKESEDNIPAMTDPECVKQHLQTLMESQKNDEDCAILIKTINHLFAKYESRFKEEVYKKHWNPTQELFFKTTWKVRQQSLSLEIEAKRKLGKRIFVCAGASHFFPTAGKDQSEVMETLKKYKFTIGISNNKQNATYYSFKDLSEKYNTVHA